MPSVRETSFGEVILMIAVVATIISMPIAAVVGAVHDRTDHKYKQCVASNIDPAECFTRAYENRQ